jgi:hypothetical protein
MTFKVMKAAIALLTLSLSTLAHADRRAFTRTYEYMTMPAGDLELEIYSTEVRPVLDEDPRAFELQLELEYGITDHWDISVYHVFDQASGFGAEGDEPLHYSEVKLRTRYRFGERGQLPVDPLLYLEGVKVFAADIYEVEGKIILARDFGPMTAALNLIAEGVFGDEEEFEQGFAFGLTYEAVPAFKVGAETFASMELQESEFEKWWAGPAVSWAPSPNFWWTLTVAFGLLEESDDLIARSIFGIHI